ncbi:MAG: DUF4166 domain-containing protein [Gammaproteobacteria bacterium]|nr:DUF4166 domain-containing protein [Gammaproteobacteria bacterium]
MIHSTDNTNSNNDAELKFSSEKSSDKTIRFVDVLRRHLSEEDWQLLDESIKKRFSNTNRGNQSLHFSGYMQWVYCSLYGKLIATLLGKASILPSQCDRDSLFSFTINMKNKHIRKRREYQLTDSPPFIFESDFSEQPQLHEEFDAGLGMNLHLKVTKATLWFVDAGYFLRKHRWRLRLPRWLIVGRFELMHRNLTANKFQIIIRVAHPLFGTLFYQRGEFTHEMNQIST